MTATRLARTVSALKQSARCCGARRSSRRAFVTTKKGVCYLTVKIGQGQLSPHAHLTTIRLTPQDKRDLRRLHPDVDFDWQTITRQLAAKREVCRLLSRQTT